MRLLQLCLSPNFGGLEIHFKDFCIWLSDNRQIDLFVASSDNSPIRQSLAGKNISQLSIKYRLSQFPLCAAFTLSRFIENNKIDAVHMHWKHDLALVSLAKRICRKHFFIIHTRHMDLPGSKKDIYHKFMYGKIDKFIVITDLLKEQAIRNLPLDKNKIQRIYYGCNPPTPLTADEIQALKLEFNIANTFTVGVAGRIEPQKGQHLLIHAVDNLCKEGLDIYGVLVGHAMSSEYLQKVKDLIAEKQLQKRITLIPFQNDPTKILQCLDALVLTTVKETFGIILVEAMLAGIPVIGSNAGGVPEIIDHNETGLLFDTGDIDSLSAAIRTLYLNRELKDRLAVAGQKKAETNFNKTDQFNAVLRELLVTSGF